MPSRYPAVDRPRQVVRRSLARRALGAISVGALVLAPVAALTLWLLLTDAVTAAAVMERGDLYPVVKALASLVGRAVSAVLSYV